MQRRSKKLFNLKYNNVPIPRVITMVTPITILKQLFKFFIIIIKKKEKKI